ncbi:hypothetical protein [Amycolatopsis sp.]|uniref:hypothetical protein n=1 Tax=Amycolatopsis sp. TaxID=37632 RepID=UPI002618621F|nr:hypothetical protein [Amycolatopsis sp.]
MLDHAALTSMAGPPEHRGHLVRPGHRTRREQFVDAADVMRSAAPSTTVWTAA